jgi:hypothetical protein
MKEKKWNGSWPAYCDLCNRPLTKFDTFYDGRLKGDPRWGLFCPICFDTYGVGVGTGFGQEYDSRTLKKLRG